MYDIGAVVLAAGIPKQMEPYKPLLCIGESTIIRYTLKMIKDAGADRICVVTGHHRGLIEKHLADLEVEFLYNADYATTQMYDSVLLGLSEIYSNCRRIFVAPADIPLVRLHTARKMLDVNADVVIPVCNGAKGHPVLIDSSVVPLIEKLVHPDGFDEAIDSLGVAVELLEVDDEGVIFSADVPQDYTRLLRYNAAIGDDGRVRPRLEFKLQIALDEPIFDSASARFLELIQLTGSMQMACSCVHMSYSKGWNTINHIEKQLGIPVLRRMRGGAEGGGSRLTAEGEELLRRFQGMKCEISKQGDEIFRNWFKDYMSG
jgi:molybdate transport repressor ModE-like protein